MVEKGRPLVTTTSKKTTVRCSLCGKPLDQKTAFCVIKGPKRMYFCSKQEYEGGATYVAKKQEYENKILKMVLYIVSANDIPPILFDKLLVEWLQYTDISMINAFLQEKQNALQEKISKKEIETIQKKLGYLSAIVKNNILNYVEKTKELIKIAAKSPAAIYEEEILPKLCPRTNIRRSLVEIEDNYKEEEYEHNT